jgi:hypothetical protein
MSPVVCTALPAKRVNGLPVALVLVLVVSAAPSLMAQTTARAARRGDRPAAANEFAESHGQPVGRPKRDSLANGFWLGAGAGFVIGFVGAWAATANRTASGPVWSSENVGVYASIGLVGAAVGALAGTAIDALAARENRFTREQARCRVVLATRRQAIWCRLTS